MAIEEVLDVSTNEINFVREVISAKLGLKLLKNAGECWVWVRVWFPEERLQCSSYVLIGNRHCCPSLAHEYYYYYPQLLTGPVSP